MTVARVPDGHFKQHFLSRKGRKWRTIRMLDVVVLLYHVYQGLKDDDVGYEDAEDTLALMTRRLSPIYRMDPKILESALWSCNLLNEKGKWWHPNDRTFDEFIRDVLGEDSFNKTYNVIEFKGEK
jgi:hypothetical protein